FYISFFMLFFVRNRSSFYLFPKSIYSLFFTLIKDNYLMLKLAKKAIYCRYNHDIKAELGGKAKCSQNRSVNYLVFL
ncbi:hypothetical protein, partial [Enterococcus faecium]|uniref:hypothetical protein n=2 Tax=Enterococcus faecium TaxID=1352 RepID=UPI0029300771